MSEDSLIAALTAVRVFAQLWLLAIIIYSLVDPPRHVRPILFGLLIYFGTTFVNTIIMRYIDSALATHIINFVGTPLLIVLMVCLFAAHRREK